MKMEIVNIPFVKKSDDIKTPAYAHKGDAGLDLFIPVSTRVPAGKQVFVDSGIAFALPDGYAWSVRPKSGLAKDYELTITNTPGTIDSQYRNWVGVLLKNNGRHGIAFSKDEKFAQLVLEKIPRANLLEVKSLDVTDRWQGGFGSTGR